MTEEQVKQEEVEAMEATEMANGRVELCPGVMMDSYLTVGSALALQERFPKGLNSIDWTDLNNALVVLYYLVQQVDEDLTETDFRKKISKVPVPVISKNAMKALKVRLKNSQEPDLVPEAIEKTDLTE